MLVSSVAPSVTFKGSDNNMRIPHTRPKANALVKAALLGTLASTPITLGGCPSAEFDPNEKPPVKVDPNPPATGGTAGTAGVGGTGGTGGATTSPVVNDASPKNVYMGKLQAAKIIPADAIDYQGSLWYDEGNVVNIDEAVKSSTTDSMIVSGQTTHQGGIVTKYEKAFTVNPDGSVNLDKTVNGNVTERYKITNQTRTINGKSVVFADFECLKGGFHYSLSALGDGSGIVNQYGNGDYTKPFNTLSGYKIKVDGKDPVLVRNIKRAVDYDFNGNATKKVENPVVVYAKGLFKETKQRIAQELQPQKGFQQLRRLEKFA